MSSASSEPTTSARAPRRAAARSLLPREHGAWAQLALPMATVFLGARPTLAGIALTCSACAAFLLHEPWLLLDGQRGSRALREDGERARRRLFGLVAVVGLSGGFGIAFGGVRVALVTLIPAALAAVVAWFVHLRRERTLGGEIAAALALPALALPVAVASGVAVEAALWTFAAWAMVFAVATRVVRGIVSREGRRIAIVPALVFATLVALSLFGTLSWLFALALAPTCLVGVLAGLLDVEPKDLRRVGWVLAAASVVTALVLSIH